VLSIALAASTLANLEVVCGDRERTRSFSGEFDDEFAIGPEAGNGAFFGCDVLRGLIEGIDDFINLRQPRWQVFRSLGPCLLGSARWIDDPELVSKLKELSGASIVVTKQPRKHHDSEKMDRLRELNEGAPGLPIRAFPALGGLAPKIDGEPLVVGPSAPMDETVLPTIRTLGYRKGSRRDSPPIMHAKLALLGHMWWHDEGPLGHVEDVIGFKPRRLWVSSANFTQSSRRSLEFGYWTEDAALVEGAERFLLKAIEFSEDLDAEADHLEPDLAAVEFDDVEMAEALAEMDWDEEDREEV
jgi:hypothetical protein